MAIAHLRPLTDSERERLGQLTRVLHGMARGTGFSEKEFDNAVISLAARTLSHKSIEEQNELVEYELIRVANTMRAIMAMKDKYPEAQS